MRTTSLASVGRIRRSTTLASMMRLLPENPNILTPEYQMDYISAFQHATACGLRLSAFQHAAGFARRLVSISASRPGASPPASNPDASAAVPRAVERGRNQELICRQAR